MILSVSRRTDIPSFYSDWFFNRLKAGFLYVRNHMNPHHISKIDLSPELVDCIVFWTKNPEPMLSRLNELKDYSFYFQFTLTGYGTDIESNVPHKRDKMIPIFQDLSSKIGSNRMIWRYDPILFTTKYTPEYHIKAFRQIAESLNGFTNRCVISFVDIYAKFDAFLRNQIQTAQSIIYAFSIKDHSMGATFKLYDDRQFCNGHRTVTMGMPIGYLISGNYSEENNLQMILEARAQVGGNFLAGIATDENDPNTEIDNLATKLCYALEHQYVPPQNFYGIGGMKIFRDLIWLMQGMMKADHRFYKAHKQYDFPQKKFGTMLAMYLVGALISSPKLKAKIGNKMNEGMIAPYKKVLDKLD